MTDASARPTNDQPEDDLPPEQNDFYQTFREKIRAQLERIGPGFKYSPGTFRSEPISGPV